MFDPHTRPSRSTAFCSARPSWLLAFGVAAVGLAGPAVAAAPESSCALECEKGSICRVYSACPDSDCENPADCPECPRWPVCDPAPCEIDDDCGSEQACAEQTSWDCSFETRGEVPDRPCEPRNVLQCTPRWQLPCVLDADCGEGFTCEERMICGPTPAAVPEDKAQDLCRASGTFSCVPREIACDNDADCPSAFECVPNHGGCSSSSDGQMVCVSVDPPQLCVVRSSGTPPGNAPAYLAPRPAAEESGSDEAPAPMANCSLNGAAVSGGWLGLVSMAGLAAAFRARRKHGAR